MKDGLVLITLLLVGSSSYGDTPPKPNIRVTTNSADPRLGKPAWDWSDTERIKLRFDPAAVRERVAAHSGTAQPRMQTHSAERSPGREHVIDGSRDAALFLPVELLDVLIQGLHPDVSIRTPARLALAKGIQEMGYSEDAFWARLAQISAPYRSLLARPHNVTVQRVKTAEGNVVSFPIDVDRCVARHNLLQSAKTTFGAAPFQRFLYTAVAPEVKRVVTTQQDDPAQELLFVANGCRQ